MIDVKELSVFSHLSSDEKVGYSPPDSIIKSPSMKQKYLLQRKAKSVFDEDQYTYVEVDLNQFDGPVDEMFQPLPLQIIRPAIPIMTAPFQKTGPNMFPQDCVYPSLRVLVPTSESDKSITTKQGKETDSRSVLEKISDFFKSKPVNDKVQTTTSEDDITIQPPSPQPRQFLRYHDLREPFPDASTFAGTLFMRRASGDSKTAIPANHQSTAEHHYGNNESRNKQYIVNASGISGSEVVNK